MAEIRQMPERGPDSGLGAALTVRQRRVLEVIRNSVDRRGYPPSLREIGEWVGLTELYQPALAMPGTLRQGLTGVRRAWRGKGVAWALKLAAAARAKEQGWQRILTGNHVNNREMLGINEAMGFVKQPARVILKRAWHG